MYDCFNDHQWPTIVLCFQLGMCVGGVSTLIASSVDDDLKLDQFAEVGIFLQVESLLSTYGNELGMLQVCACILQSLLETYELLLLETFITILHLLILQN